MALERADVLVIGSGAAGAAITKRLAELGANVACLEQGEWMKPSAFPTGPDEEAQLRRRAHSFSPNVRQQPQDYPVSSAGADSPEVEMFNAVGGSTLHWNCGFGRLHPSDFRVRSLDGEADDWPIRYEDLAPYYDLNDREMGASGLAGDPANLGKTPPLPPLPLWPSGRALARGFNRLGWHWWPSTLAILSESYGGRPGCNFEGRGWYGCGVDARSSAANTYWPKALQSGAKLIIRARVREITVDRSGRAQGALYYDSEGRLREYHARVVVVSANGIGSARLLLNSKSKYFPDGLGNQEGLVGQCSMFHVWAGASGIFQQAVQGHRPVYDPLFSQQFYETDAKRGFIRGFTLLVHAGGGPLGRSHGVPWGASHHRELRRRFPHTITVLAVGEDLPNKPNRVELDSSRADSNGIPGARITYSMSENSRRMMRHAQAMAQQVLEAAGAVQVSTFGPWTGTSHFMGTVRMGNDPRRSVVDAWHRIHGVENTFVVDGGSFPTSGAVGPTSTIGALALRCAEGIWRRRQDWK
jgi:choline dehydrogenase-like flavoprotein